MTLDEALHQVRHKFEMLVSTAVETADTIPIDTALGELIMAAIDAREVIDSQWRERRTAQPTIATAKGDLEFINSLDLEDLGL